MKSECNFPNEIITEKHLQFFYKYGFMMIRGLHNQEMIKNAFEAANSVIKTEVKDAEEQGRQPNFSSSSPGKQKFYDQRLIKYFQFPKNHKLCENIIGEFKFNQFQFAPRFFRQNVKPYVPKENQIKTLQPYDLKNLPKQMSEWSKEFLFKAHDLGIHFAPSSNRGWHIDGSQERKVAHFSMLWGSYISNIPKGNMGNLLVYPGTHHTIANQLRKGQNQFFDKINDKKPEDTLHVLRKEGIADAEPYALLAEAGDIIIAHPWLAHGIATNIGPQTRLALYIRVSNSAYMQKYRCNMAGSDIKPNKQNIPQPEKWVGECFANSPYINEWIKQNHSSLRKYDEGSLEKAMKSI